MLRVLTGCGVAAAIAAGVAFVPGCSFGESNDSLSPGSSGDGGTSEDATDGTIVDSGAPDTFVSADGQAAGDGSADAGTTTIAFVHASPSLPSVRLCWGPAGSAQGAPGLAAFPADNEMPASNYPGIAVGGVAWGTFPSNLPDLRGGTVYAISAKRIAGVTKTCEQLICTGASSCLTKNQDYWSLGTLDGNLLGPGSYLVAIAGCFGAADLLATQERCGADWNAATGNLHLDVLPVANPPASDGGILTVQTVQLSPRMVWMQGDAGATTVSFGAESDAQAFAQLTWEGDLEPSLPQPLLLPGDLASMGGLGFAVDLSGANASDAGRLWMSLAESLDLVDPQEDPATYYASAGMYVVAVVGDPTAARPFSSDGDASYDGTGLHLLVVSTAMPRP